MQLPSCCQSTGSPADKSSVRWPYQSVSLLGLTNNTFFNFIAGNSILIINTGHSFNLVLLLLLVPIYTHIHSNQALYFYYKLLQNPFQQNFKDCSPRHAQNTSPRGADVCTYGCQPFLWRGVGSSNALYKKIKDQVPQLEAEEVGHHVTQCHCRHLAQSSWTTQVGANSALAAVAG